jgi:hypothetical protein
MSRVRANQGRFAGAWRGDAPESDRGGATGLLNALTVRGAVRPLARVQRAYEAGSEAEKRVAVEALAAERLPFEEYVLELTLLGLRDRKHSPDEYAAALGPRVRKRVGISVLSNAEFELGAEDAVDIDGSFGRLVFVPESDEVRVEVPAGLSPWLHLFTVGHELGHLAAAHPPRVAASSSAAAEVAGTEGRAQPLPHRLARKSPLVSGLPPEALDDLYEAEADLRAQYAIITSSLGPVAAQTSRLSQIG